MSTNRRTFIKAVGATAAAVGVSSTPAAGAAQAGAPGLRALAFDAYGTLFDVFSVTALCEQLFPGNGDALAQVWRAKQLQYSLLRSLMGRYADFWQVTQDGLVYGAKSLSLDLTADRRRQLMDAYLNLTAFPDVRPGLEALRARGVRLAILSNGEPKMLAAAARNAGIDTLLDRIISADEVKAFKPAPPVYALGPARLGVTTGQMGFVSSNSWDINGATSAGLTTFWIQRNAAVPPEELAYNTDRVVGAITDLPAVFGA
jgi:2-haloacid dehalogenase